MLSRVVVVVLTAVASGCNDAVLLAITSDRPVPSAVDAICVGVADASLDGRPFGQAYRLEGELATLPQTLRVEPGSADGAWAWVRADRGGVPVASAGTRLDFSGDAVVSVDRCVRGAGAAPTTIGAMVGPANARLAASRGAGGVLVIAIGTTAEILDARSGGLVAALAPAPPAGAVVDVIAADLDGDCDDDLVVATDGAAPALWRRDGVTLADVGTLGGTPIQAVVAADVDRDGDVDLITGGGGSLALWRNDGSGTFTHDPPALSGDGRVSAVRALAIGDLDHDGNPDLIVGQAGGPLVAWLGEPGGTGSMLAADAVVPPVPLDVARLVLADADGDFDPDLAVAVRGAPWRLYIDRAGRLEDQSFVRLPQPAPIALALALGGWDDGCEPDAVIAAAGGTPTLRGAPTGTFVADAAAPAASDVVLADIDDDGDLDTVFAGAQGVTWLAR